MWPRSRPATVAAAAACLAFVVVAAAGCLSRPTTNPNVLVVGITSDPNSGIGDWSPPELANYLAVGHADKHGSAAGPMPVRPSASFG